MGLLYSRTCAVEEEAKLPSTKANSETVLVPSGDVKGQTDQQSKILLDDVEKKNKALDMRMKVVREIVRTEEEYVKRLSLIVDGYISNMQDVDCEIKMPEDLRSGKEKLIFGNIEKIYQWHKDHFLEALNLCVEHPEELGPLFIRSKNHLYMHVVFCKNVSFSQHIVSQYLNTYFAELKNKMGHNQTLESLMITPVQRITKYPLLLKEVLKYTDQAKLTDEVNTLQQVIETTKDLAKAAEGMVYIGRLQGFDVKLQAHGHLVIYDDELVCSEKTSSDAVFKGRNLHVFLLEQILIFSEIANENSPRVHYKNHIQLNQMKLQEKVTTRKNEKSGGVELFCVESTNPRKPFACLCQAKDTNMREKWISNLRKHFKTQDELIKAMSSPIKYQKSLMC